MLTSDELETEMWRLSRLLDQGISALRTYSSDYAVAEDAYRMARAKAILAAEGTVEEKRAMADLATSRERVEAHMLDGLRKAALEAGRARRQQLSAWQTMASAWKAEAEVARFGPELSP